MAVPVRISREVVARKPPHGTPCNRCGLCCMVSLCKLGQAVFRRPEFPGPCPALVMAPDGTASCGVADRPRIYAPKGDWHTEQELREAALLIIGARYNGCDCRINGEPINQRFEDRLTEWDRDNAAAVDEAKQIWGVPTPRSTTKPTDRR